MANIKHEAPSQRMHYRLTVPITIEIGGTVYKSSDWSMGGFRIENIEREMHADDIFDAVISINFQGYAISFVQKSQVVRYDSEKKMLAAQFLDMDERTSDILTFFSQGLVSGEMGTAGEAIRRIDTPVTPVELTKGSGDEKIPARRQIKRTIIAALYMTVGLAIAVYIGITLYSTFFRIQVETGVVAAHVEPLISPQEGILEKILVPDDGRVSKGQPIIMLYNARQMEAVRLAEVAVQAAKHRYENLQNRLDSESISLGIYRQVGQSRLKSARDKVSKFEEEVALAKAELRRKQQLLDQGVLSRSEVEREQQRVTSIERNLLEARAELQMAKDSFAALKEGLFFSGNQVEGETLGLKAQLEAAANDVEIEQERLEVAREQLEKYVLKSPFDGTVVKVFKTVGNTVETGEQLAIIEQHKDRFVTAYLTQDEVENIQLGDTAMVFIPALDLRVNGKVVLIDRTSGFVSEMEGRFKWRTAQDRSALAIVEFNQPDMPGLSRDIPTGLPAVVNFRRVATSELLTRVLRFFGYTGGEMQPEDAESIRQDIYKYPVTSPAKRPADSYDQTEN